MFLCFINMYIVKKIQLSKFEDLVGFIQQFTNGTASHLATRMELQGTVQNGKFLKAEREWDKKVINKRKGYFRQHHLPLREGREADYLPGACQEISY